ncbi:hypothetical protein FKM82_005610 [Ascaphus truei]
MSHTFWPQGASLSPFLGAGCLLEHHTLWMQGISPTVILLMQGVFLTVTLSGCHPVWLQGVSGCHTLLMQGVSLAVTLPERRNAGCLSLAATLSGCKVSLAVTLPECKVSLWLPHVLGARCLSGCHPPWMQGVSLGAGCLQMTNSQRCILCLSLALGVSFTLSVLHSFLCWVILLRSLFLSTVSLRLSLSQSLSGCHYLPHMVSQAGSCSYTRCLSSCHPLPVTRRLSLISPILVLT